MNNEVFKADEVFPEYDFDRHENNRVEETEHVYQKLYHVTGWDEIKDLEPGDAFTLKVGEHNAQGEGVYFSETVPRLTAAEGAKGNPKAIIEIVAQDVAGWYRSKNAFVSKYRKPRTWHTEGKDVHLVVLARNNIDFSGQVTPMLNCAWRWEREDEVRHEEVSKRLSD